MVTAAHASCAICWRLHGDCGTCFLCYLLETAWGPRHMLPVVSACDYMVTQLHMLPVLSQLVCDRDCIGTVTPASCAVCLRPACVEIDKGSWAIQLYKGSRAICTRLYVLLFQAMDWRRFVSTCIVLFFSVQATHFLCPSYALKTARVTVRP